MIPLKENETIVGGYIEPGNGAYHYALTSFGRVFRRHWRLGSVWHQI